MEVLLVSTSQVLGSKTIILSYTGSLILDREKGFVICLDMKMVIEIFVYQIGMILFAYSAYFNQKL